MAQKNYLFIMVVVLFLLVVTGGLWWYSTRSAEKPSGNNDQAGNGVPIEAEYEGKIVYTTAQDNVDVAALRAHCESQGGEFNTCGTTCAPDAAVCAQVCAYTCEFGQQGDNGQKDKVGDIPLDVESWSEYASSGLGVSFSYPPQFELEEQEGSASVTYQGPTQREGTELYDGVKLTVRRHIYSSDLTLQDYVQERISETRQLGEIKKPMATTTLADKEGYAYTVESLGTITHIYLPVGQNQALQLWYLSPDPENIGYDKVTERMLASFKVLPDRLGTIGVDLYYPNEDKAEKIGDPCSPASLKPVDAKISVSPTPVKDTIQKLIQGGLSQVERGAGFTTEFPGEGFELTGAELNNGTLTLTFNDPNDFTSGGSCRAGLLRAQIEQTAKQFTEVDKVDFRPDTLFQP